MEFEARLISDDGTEYALGESLTVGRSDDCDITLPSGKVSRQHARFSVSDGGITVEDLGSSNGTRLNGRGISGAQALMDGDEVRIDTFILKVVVVSPIQSQDDDATVIAPQQDDDATVLAPEPASPEPAPAHKPTPAAPPTPDPSPSPPSSGDLPGSWVDSGTGESTQFLSPDALAAERPPDSVARHSPLAHLVVLAADGSARDVFELETGAGDEDSWELGRDDSCDIQLDDPTVSARHAQLIQREGRWRMVNLISSNGIVVNGEKRLSVYLGGGDSVQLGEIALVFHAPEGYSPSAKATAQDTPGTTASGGAAKWRTPLFIGIAVVVIVAVIAAVVFAGLD